MTARDTYPLHGVRILDMATVLAAPFAATLCGDMGAEVVKLELPAGNDALRGLAPVHEGHALFWKTANRGKKGISLDVRKPEGRTLFLRLIERFDVLVENFRTGTLDGWGLDLARIFHRSRATNEYGIALVCPKIQVSNLDQRAGNAEAKLYRRN